ncbi:MAG: hypothetical protein FWG89_09355, partial [Treponema sp.]|nr:hypothetical protein [Treponema sp.]
TYMGPNGAEYDGDGKKENGDMWYNEDGYDIFGFDKNGFEYLEPVAVPDVRASATTQSLVSLRLEVGRNALKNNFADATELFNGQHAVPPHLHSHKDAILGSMSYEEPVGTNLAGWYGNAGFYAISEYIITMRDLLPEDQQEKFMLVIDAHRTREYAEWRTYGDAGASATNELKGIYNELLGMGVVGANEAGFENYMKKEFIPDLSRDLGINPGLIKTLLNQMTGWERFFALINDADAQNLGAIIGGSAPMYAKWDTRTLEFICEFYADIEKEREQQQGK